MTSFKRLRLHGFKSFVEKTDIDIGPGLTGIVGPNGCGKSNLVEALRWVMGESSARKMRGDGMDDVIFAGTDRRPARNNAEVSILMENSDRGLPPPYQNAEEIEVVRRIDRDQGSSYKINGRPARARDVQMLFADTLTGSQSPSLVPQGRVTSIINAKPSERRLILEESAGIAGLFARRHEAELKLKGTDQNLLRVEDVLGSMEQRLQALKKQARQASRYRNISAQIKQLELAIAWMEWQTLKLRYDAAEHEFTAAEQMVGEKMSAVLQLNKTQESLSADLPALRQAEAQSAAALQAQRVTLHRLDDESERLDRALEEVKTQKAQAKSDRDHEESSQKDIAQMQERMAVEEATLQTERAGEGAAIDAAIDARDTLMAKIAMLEKDYSALTQDAAEYRARRGSLENQKRQTEQAVAQLQNRCASLKQQLEAQQQQDTGAEELKTLAAAIEDAETALTDARARLVKEEEALATLKAACDKQADAVRDTEGAEHKLKSEIKTIQSLLKTLSNDEIAPVIDQVKAAPGCEMALARALGDALMATLEQTGKMVWQAADSRNIDMNALPPLPAGAKPLSDFVTGPAELASALRMAGILDEGMPGETVARALKPGQILVSRDGALWRWDGLHVRPEAQDRQALHLEQKNRIARLETELAEISARLASVREDKSKLDDARRQTDEKISATRQMIRQTDNDLSEKRRTYAKIQERQASYAAGIARLTESLSLATQDLDRQTQTLADCNQSLEAFADTDIQQRDAAIATLKQTLDQERTNVQDALRTLDRLKQEQGRREARLRAIADERVNLQNRIIRARERLKQLDERLQGLEEKDKELRSRPRAMEEDRQRLLTNISKYERERHQAVDQLTTREREISQTAKALRETEQTLADARERRAHAHGTVVALKQQLDGVYEQTQSQFGLEPHQIPEQMLVKVDSGDGEAEPETAAAVASGSLEKLKSQKERLTRERDAMGPVNLVADQEAQALETEMATLMLERNDLQQAVDELRTGIQKLNREARERLTAAFTRVNLHFQDLFKRLFNGGKAHLAMIESDDPLESGLEIYAQPPGKALQSLTLLSGGEQTLTAIALIFAMFLTNPAPICVLDEIDAPLDDANVDRVCDMLHEIAKAANTRFLVITHHRLTMARMDRLYGVTMGERGVSQLVSVDLQQELDLGKAA